MKPKKIEFKRLKALFIKECLQIRRDVSSILICVVMPFLLLFLYGYGVSLDLKHLRIGLVLEDTAPDANDFAASLIGSSYFDVTIKKDRRELIEPLLKGSIRGMVVVPSYFSEFKDRKNNVAPIQVIADGSEPNTANFLLNYVKGAFENYLKVDQREHHNTDPSLLQASPRFWYNETLESRFFLLPGSLAIIMTLIGTLLTALVIAREWERGTMEALLSTSLTKYELLLGKVIPYFLLGLISLFISVFLTLTVFSVPFRGSFFALFLLSSSFLYCALSVGLMISTLTRSQLLSYQMAIVSGFLPAYMLSGFLFEIASMPFFTRVITYVLPARYYVQGLQTLFLVGNVWEILIFDMVPMLLLGTIFFTITIRKTKLRLD